MISKTAKEFSPLQYIKRAWTHDTVEDFSPRHLQELNRIDVLDNSQDERGEEESKKQPKPLTDHELKLWSAIQLARKGKKYCHDADATGAHPPWTLAWRAKAKGERYHSYAAAHRNERMRPLISDEKHRIRKKAIALGLDKSR